MKVIHERLIRHIEEDIIPVYEKANRAHSKNHIKRVIDYSLKLARELDVDLNITYTAAAYHDIGIIGWGAQRGESNQTLRAKHHKYSAIAVKESKELNELFNKDELEIISSACFNHRASNSDNPVTLYGKVVADADRLDGFKLNVLFKRCYEYDRFHYPEKSMEETKEGIFSHVKEKYGYFGYAYDSLYLPITKRKFATEIGLVKKICSDKKQFDREFRRWSEENTTFC